MTSLPPSPGSYEIGTTGQTTAPISTRDLYGSSSIRQFEEAGSRPHIRTFKIPGSPLTVGVELLWDDLSGGYAYEDTYDYVFNKVQTSTMSHNRRNRLILPHLYSTSTVDTLESAPAAHFSINMFGKLIIGAGDTADKAIAVESDYTVTAVTYTPGSNISGLKDIIANNIHYLGVLREGGVIDLKTDVAFTDAGTDFPAGTNPGWGAIISLVNSASPGTPQNLLYCGTSMFAVSGSAALGAALPTATLTNIPGGGYDIGADTLENTPLRAYWYWPLSNITTSILSTSYSQFAGPLRGQVVSTSMEGKDPWAIPFPLAAVYHPVLWDHKVVADDGIKHYAYLGGNNFQPLASAFDPIISATVRQKIMCNGTFNGELYTLVVNFKSSDGDTNFGQLKKYDARKNIWLPISKQITQVTSVLSSAPSVRGWPADMVLGSYDQLPISARTGILHLNTGALNITNAHGGIFLEQPSTDSFVNWNLVSDFEASGITTLPITHLPYPLAGREFHLDAMESGADVEAGGTTTVAAKITYAYGCGDSNFTDALVAITSRQASQRWQRWDNPDPSSLQDRLQLRITGSRHTGGTTTTFNALPFRIFLRCVVPEDVYEQIFSQRGY